MKQFIKVFLVLLAGTAILYRIKENADGVFVFDFLFDLSAYCFAAGVGIFVVWSDIKTIRRSRRVSSLSATILFVSLALICFAMQYYYYQREEMPVLIYGNYDGDFNGTSISLRTDGTYQVNNYCMGSDLFYGKYTMQDSIVTLDRDNIDNVVGRRLIIRTANKTIIQVDSSGKEVPHLDPFQLIEDNRKAKTH